jgi:ribonucleotide reductase beta subunit family protein with ferritin-like domain
MATCQGCRKEKCKLFKTCNVRVCSEEKQVDYCFQCSHFPCENTGFDEHLYKRFVAINRRMQEVGVEKYYEEVKDLPRY